jgi:hypothetical protein
MIGSQATWVSYIPLYDYMNLHMTGLKSLYTAYRDSCMEPRHSIYI